ncbi:hypothetical protein HDV00_011175 [Rhizophlyctis rosea]|nr:hypothetical protein HDV00_011175 [Rhizophlyctis rosea]
MFVTCPVATGVTILAPVRQHYVDILSVQAQDFVATLNKSVAAYLHDYAYPSAHTNFSSIRAFNGRRKSPLQLRVERPREVDGSTLPDFLPQTRWIREDPTWRGAPPAPGLADRRIEITGPGDRNTVIEASNSGASTYMADFEDSNAPTWENNLSGQCNLRDAVRGNISFTAPNGKQYKTKEGKLATLIVRPRGWHMEEKRFLVDGEPCSASIFDFALYFFHNGAESVKRGFGPYFYLPKLESHLEARLWNDIFNLAQDMLNIPRGTIRGTVLIETILAAFEMEEIIYELRDHSSGLKASRWNYIFSFIKKFRNNPNMLLPDRRSVTMTTPFMSAYVHLLIKTCHRRGVPAIGTTASHMHMDAMIADFGMLSDDCTDKIRQMKAGHDGTSVVHPSLVNIVRVIVEKHMLSPYEVHNLRENGQVSAHELISTDGVLGCITKYGVRGKIDVALQYMEAWLRGVGAATAEISRSQLWQWVKHRARTEEGKEVTPEFVKGVLGEVLEGIEKKMGAEKFKRTKFEQAKQMLEEVVGREQFDDFLMYWRSGKSVPLNPIPTATDGLVMAALPPELLRAVAISRITCPTAARNLRISCRGLSKVITNEDSIAVTARFKMRDGGRVTCWIWAWTRGYWDILTKCTPWMSEEYQTSALVLAANEDRVDAIQGLLKAVEFQQHQLLHALFVAVWKNHTDVVRVLVEAGARDGDLTCRDYAEWVGFPEYYPHQHFWALNFATDGDIVKMLLDSQSYPREVIESSFLYTSVEKSVDAVRALMEAGARPDPACLGGAGEMTMELIQFLMEKGYDLRVDDDAPLLSGVWNDRTDLVQLCLDAGANIHATGWSDGTDRPDILQEAYSKGNEEIIRLVLEPRPDL